MILTAAEIRDLAMLAGFVIDTLDVDMAMDFTVEDCPKCGIKYDNGEVLHYEHVAYDSEYPEEGVLPLGDPVEPDECVCQKCFKPWKDHEFGVPEPYCP